MLVEKNQLEHCVLTQSAFGNIFLEALNFFSVIAFKGFFFFFEIVFQLHFPFSYPPPNLPIYFSLPFFKSMTSVFIYCYCMHIYIYICIYCILEELLFVPLGSFEWIEARDPANLLARTGAAPSQ